MSVRKDKVKVILVGRYSTTVVEANIGEKFITIGSSRYTKDTGISESGLLGIRSYGFYSVYVYSIESPYALGKLKEYRTEVNQRKIVELSGKLTYEQTLKVLEVIENGSV